MFKKMFCCCSGFITDAIEALDRGDSEQAKSILIEAQQEAEEPYIVGTEQ